MEKNIKVAILGVGNCASSFVQGIVHYSNSDNEDGLISDVIGGYKVSNIEVVAAYDINTTKVGKDLRTKQLLLEELDLLKQKPLN